jgi:hypothetical protein
MKSGLSATPRIERPGLPEGRAEHRLRLDLGGDRRDSKLIVTYFVGSRDQHCANRFMLDVASRVRGRVQLTTDAHNPYAWAVALAFEDGAVD